MVPSFSLSTLQNRPRGCDHAPQHRDVQTRAEHILLEKEMSIFCFDPVAWWRWISTSCCWSCRCWCVSLYWCLCLLWWCRTGGGGGPYPYHLLSAQLPASPGSDLQLSAPSNCFFLVEISLISLIEAEQTDHIARTQLTNTSFILLLRLAHLWKSLTLVKSELSKVFLQHSKWDPSDWGNCFSHRSLCRTEVLDTTRPGLKVRGLRCIAEWWM